MTYDAGSHGYVRKKCKNTRRKESHTSRESELTIDHGGMDGGIGKGGTVLRMVGVTAGEEFLRRRLRIKGEEAQWGGTYRGMRLTSPGRA